MRHAAPLLYAVLAECGYFPVSELNTLRQIDSHLQGHADRTSTPGVEMSSGSLGQGLSFAVGVALAGRLDSRDYRVYALLSDGECDEGQVWEAAMFAGAKRLFNLTQIIDRNNIQIDGHTEDVMPLESLKEKYESFGWHVIEVGGHDMRAIDEAVKEARGIFEKPAVIIAHTIPGKGVTAFEGRYEWHGKVPSKEEGRVALDNLAK